MDAVADILRDDDAPPPSGVRVRVPAAPAPARPSAPAPRPSDRDVLADVGEEVFFEVLDVVLALAPLQGRWLRLGLRELEAAVWMLVAVEMGGPRPPQPPQARSPKPSLAGVLRGRWPELVPGYASMDRLVGLMVDAIC